MKRKEKRDQRSVSKARSESPRVKNNNSKNQGQNERYQGKGQSSPGNTSRSANFSNIIICHKCGGAGHLKRFCPSDDRDDRNQGKKQYQGNGNQRQGYRNNNQSQGYYKSQGQKQETKGRPSSERCQICQGDHIALYCNRRFSRFADESSGRNQPVTRTSRNRDSGQGHGSPKKSTYDNRWKGQGRVYKAHGQGGDNESRSSGDRRSEGYESPKSQRKDHRRTKTRTRENESPRQVTQETRKSHNAVVQYDSDTSAEVFENTRPANSEKSFLDRG